jgi:hypothetical protein
MPILILIPTISNLWLVFVFLGKIALAENKCNNAREEALSAYPKQSYAF